MVISFVMAALLALPARATLCAVTVHVSPAMSVPVRLYDQRGSLVAETLTENGVIAFCDLGFGEHSVEIGVDGCGMTVLRRVRMSRPGGFGFCWQTAAPKIAHRKQSEEDLL